MLIATNAITADWIKGNSRPDFSNIPIKLIGIPKLIRGIENFFDKSFLNLPSKYPIKRHGINSVKR